MPSHDQFIIVRYGELSTKGKNRKDFVKRLKNNISRRLQANQGLTIRSDYNRIVIDCHEVDPKDLVDRLKTVYGISSFLIGRRVEKNLDTIIQTAVNMVMAESGKTFKVVSRRRDKTFEVTSDQLNRLVATKLLTSSSWKVDVHEPDVVVKIEIDQKDVAYITCQEIVGAKGLPVGTSGKGLLLLSGGIDSSVAASLMMKRGMVLDMIHFESMPYTSLNALEKVKSLARILTKFQYRIHLHMVHLTEVQLEINEKIPESYHVTILRRIMVRIAEKLAQSIDAKALVTGESLGQVASQTLESINVIQEAIDSVVLRPLIGLDKNEIIALAKSIGSYETSILPFEDCCTIFTPQAPVTRPSLKKVLEYEKRLDIDHLVELALSQVTMLPLVDEPVDMDLF